MNFRKSTPFVSLKECGMFDFVDEVFDAEVGGVSEADARRLMRA